MLRLAPWSVLVGLAGCGPSVQAVYESSVRFEHCNRLDLDPDVAPTHREACWRDWLRRHTVGQTDDRLEYARLRVRELRAGQTDTLTLDLGDAGAEAGAATPPPTAAPPSASAPAPPPPAPPASASAAPARQPKAAPGREPRR